MYHVSCEWLWKQNSVKKGEAVTKWNIQQTEHGHWKSGFYSQKYRFSKARTLRGDGSPSLLLTGPWTCPSLEVQCLQFCLWKTKEKVSYYILVLKADTGFTFFYQHFCFLFRNTLVEFVFPSWTLDVSKPYVQHKDSFPMTAYILLPNDYIYSLSQGDAITPSSSVIYHFPFKFIF